MQLVYPRPKCKFGKYDMIVDATYVMCTISPTRIEEWEPRHRHKVKILFQTNPPFRTRPVSNVTTVPI